MAHAKCGASLADGPGAESKCHGATEGTVVILFCLHPNEERQMYYFIKGKDSVATIGKKVLHIHEALGEARYMVERGMTNVSIEDNGGHSIDGSDLLACIKGEKVLSDDLQAHYVS
jgi:hypothetical protein